MLTHCGKFRRYVIWGTIALAAAAPANAADDGGWKGAAAAIAGVLIVSTILQFLLAILLPRFTMRLRTAIRTGFWPSAGWGALVATLTVIVFAVMSQGGQAGKAVGATAGIAVALLAFAGAIGVSGLIGDWALRRWEIASPGPFAVLCGALVWAFGAAVPIFGWAAGLLTLFASLGAAVQVLLQPRVFDPPAPPVPPVLPDDPSAPT